MNTFLWFVRADWWLTLKYFVLWFWTALMAIGFGGYHWPLSYILELTWLVPVFFVVGLSLRYALFLLILRAHKDFESAYQVLARGKRT